MPGDERGLRAGLGLSRRTDRRRRQCLPGAADPPLVREPPGRLGGPMRRDAAHAERPIRLVIGEPRDERNGGARDQLAHEHDAAPRLAPAPAYAPTLKKISRAARRRWSMLARPVATSTYSMLSATSAEGTPRRERS